MSSSQIASRHQAGSDFQPYIGLRPFTEQEKDRFFGRSNEASILLDKIRANRLTLLLAASGVGKSSLLQAGIMPELRTDSNIELIYYNVWSASPQAFKQAVSEHYGEPYKDVSLKSILRACTLFSSSQLVLLLDQFEELFNYHRFKPEFQPFIEELSAAVLDRSLPVSFVFSMREDFALELNSFKESLPGVFDNYFRLDKLTCDQAREAIEKPLEGTGYCFAPETGNQEALLDQVLHDLAKREQERQFGVQKLLELKELPLLVEPPHLQIVCQELWERHLDEKAKQITHAAYEKAGRTAGILNSYFLGKIDLFSKKEQALASSAFDHLVGTRAIKIAHPLERLVELTRADAEDLQSVLDRLQNYAILRRQKRGDDFWYELYHDIFSESIDHWNRGFKARQRMKRFSCGAFAALFASCVIFAGNNWRTNYYGRYLQLSPKVDVSDRIEVYQGTLTGWGIFHQRHFCFESPFLRQELEADKRFDHSIVEDKENTRANLVGRLPLLERLPRYAKNGLYRKGYRGKGDEEDKLFETILKTGEKDLVSSLPSQLASVRTTKSFDRLLQIVNSQGVVTALAQLGNKSALVKLLANKNAYVAVLALGELRDSSAAPVLVKLLNDEKKFMRQSAAIALGKLGNSSAAPALVKLLADENPYKQRDAAITLGKLGNSSAAPALVKLLNDEDEDKSVWRDAAFALGKLGENSGVPVLVEFLNYDGQHIRFILRANPLIRLLGDEDNFVRQSAVEALSELGDSSGLVKLLADEDADVRKIAAKVLCELRNSSVAPALVKLLNDGDTYIRRSAAFALGELGYSSAAPALAKLFTDEDADVRLSAAVALVKLRDSSAMPALVKLLNDGDTYIRRSAALILENLGDSSAAPVLVKLLEDEDAHIRLSAAEALGKLGDSSATPALIKALADEDDRFVTLRVNMVVALGKLGDSSAAPALVKVLADEDDRFFDVRVNTVVALGKLGDSSAAPVLVKLLEDENTYVRRVAAEALGELGGSLAAPALIRLLDDKDADVRTSAAFTLGKLGDSSVAPALVKLFAVEDDAYVRRSAAESLGRLKAEASVILSRYLKDPELRNAAVKALVSMNLSSPELRAWQEEQFKAAQKKIRVLRWEEAAVALGFVFTKEAVTLLSTLLAYADQNVVKAAVESIGNISEYHPGLVQTQTMSLLRLTAHTNVNLQQSAIAALGKVISFHGKEQPADLPELEKSIHSALSKILFDRKEKFIIRQTTLDVLGATGREECVAEIHELLIELDKNEDESLRYRSLLWLGRMAYSPAYDYVENELEGLEQEKAVWRKERDSKQQEAVPDELKQQDKTWKKEHWEYMLGNALARIKPETTGIDLLNHPLYQVRQGAIRALASRIADGAADAGLIGKIINAHQNFDPDDLPSPFPYAVFQAIDLSLWNLEYTGKKDDVSKLNEILKNLKPCQVPGQEGAIKERLEWTIERLDENLAKNAKTAAAE